MQLKIKAILIGGTSHSGKSTLGKTLSEKLGAKCVSTDSLARHPGRPWKENPDLIPTHVREHYASLSVAELLTDVLRHYKNLWSAIQSIIESHLADPTSELLVLEGSALLPELVNTLASDKVVAVWLTGSDDLFKKRIYASSNFLAAADAEQKLITQFLARTIRYNKMMMKEVHGLNLPSINVIRFNNLDDLLYQCSKIINLPGR